MTTPAHFNPRPLRGGRPVGGRGGFDEHGISILVFREEGDAPHQPFDKAHTVISIPAFCEEGDVLPGPSPAASRYFNPRLP